MRANGEFAQTVYSSRQPRPAGRGFLAIDVSDPALPGGAVCTSGGYARFTETAGNRYSHIIDPRTGLPAEAALSVTVVTAHIWATALSVLGRQGLNGLPAGVEGMLMMGTKEDHQMVCAPGFRGLLEERLEK